MKGWDVGHIEVATLGSVKNPVHLLRSVRVQRTSHLPRNVGWVGEASIVESLGGG